MNLNEHTKDQGKSGENVAAQWDELEKVQPLVMRYLKNSLQKKRMAHAYLFEGEHGTGKVHVSLMLAKSIFCTSPQESYIPCEACVNCKRINNGNHPDVHVLEPDGLSIKTAQIEGLQQEFSKKGVESKQKLYMIVHADKMTTNAANKLLKFLEEPNAETTAILITEQVQQILQTIISRCQTISFRSLPPQLLSAKLQEEGIHHVKASLLANMTNSVQEAVALNNDDWFVQARKIVLKLYKALHYDSLYAMVSLQEDWFIYFKERNQLDRGLDLLLLLYKDLLYIKVGKADQLIYPDLSQQLEADALQITTRQLSERMEAILEAKRKLNANMNPQLLMEQLVLNLQGGSTFV